MRAKLRICREISNSLPQWIIIALSVLACSSAALDAAPPKKTQPARSSRLVSQGPDSTPADTVDSAIDLPKRGSKEPVHICDVSAKQVGLRIENADGNPLNFRATPDKTNQSWTISDGARKIATVSRNAESLDLAWSSGAPDDAECLRNSILCVTEGEKARKFGMRQSVTIDAPVVDLSKDRASVPVAANLYGLAQKSLKLDVEGLVNNTPKVEALYPADGRADFGKKVRVALHDKPPHAGIQLGLQADKDGCVVKVEPIILDFAKKSRPWTIVRLDKFHKTFMTAISKQQRDIPRLRDRISNLESQLAALKSQLKPGALNELIVRSEIDNVAEDLAHARKNLATMQAMLPENTARVKALAPLGPLSEAVHQRAKLSFRVYYLVGNTEIDVMTINAKKSTAKRNSAADDARTLISIAD